MTQINTDLMDAWLMDLNWHWISPDRQLAITVFNINPNKSIYTLYRRHLDRTQWLGTYTIRPELFDPYRMIRRLKSTRLRSLERRRRVLESRLRDADEREAFWRSQ